VVAEGVETQAQLDFLAAADCELAQGYLFGPPMPFEEAEQAVVRLLARPGATAD
jgi:FOG: EAL domain